MFGFCVYILCVCLNIDLLFLFRLKWVSYPTIICIILTHWIQYKMATVIMILFHNFNSLPWNKKKQNKKQNNSNYNSNVKHIRKNGLCENGHIRYIRPLSSKLNFIPLTKNESIKKRWIQLRVLSWNKIRRLNS